MATRWVFLAFLGLSVIQLSYEQECPQDVVYIVDHSGTIMASAPQSNLLQNWNLMKTALNNLLGRMRFGVPNTQLATVTYGDNSTVAFNLNTYSNVNEASNAILGLDYMSGGRSNVSGALRTVTNIVLTSNGKRVGVPSICVLVVASLPLLDSDQTATEMGRIKNVCRLIIFGVGDPNRLTNLRNGYQAYVVNPTTDYFDAAYLTLNNTDTVTPISNSIALLCPTTPVPSTTPTTTTTTLAAPSGCSASTAADIVFVLDASGSIDAQNFEKMKAFISAIITNLQIDNGLIRVGLVIYSNTSQLIFGLNTYTSRGPMLAAISSTPYIRGATNTAVALAFTRSNMFGGAADRSDAPNLAIIMTDGGSSDRQATAREAALLRASGVHTLVIGVGNWVYLPEIYSIAAYPAASVVLISDYNSLNSSISYIVSVICQNTKFCNNQPCQNGGTCSGAFDYYVCQCPPGYGGQNCQQRCPAKADIVFAVDCAWSVSTDDFKKEIDFVRNVVFGVSDAETQVGMLLYSNQSSVVFNLGDFSSSSNKRLSILKSIAPLYCGGITNMTAAIVTARDQMFTAGTGDRSDAQNILVIFTAGQSPDISASFREASAARVRNIQIVVVAVGSWHSQAEVEGIASYPVSKNIISATDFSSLNGSLSNIIATTCNSVNECVSSPCQNGGTCTDLLNGYQCACTNSYTGLNCERMSSGIMDIVFAIDTSGSSTQIIDFILSFVENLEISPSKTRVGALIFSNVSTSVFDLSTYSTKQDVSWALKQIARSGVFSWSSTTNIASAFDMLRNVKFTSNAGDRNTAQNYALFFTDGVANVNTLQTVPSAIAARMSSGGIYVISLAVGSYVNLYQLISMSSVAGYPVTVAASQTVFTVTSYSALSGSLNSYLTALIGDQPNKCSNNPCQNGGTCLNDIKKFACQCPRDFSGETCARRCARQLDVAVMIDISGSGQYNQVIEVNINLATQIVLGLPVGSSQAALGVIAFGSGANVSFYLNTYNSRNDVLNALSFQLSSGTYGLQNAFQLLTSDFFVASRGARSGVKQVAIVITNSDSPYDYSGIVNAAVAVRNSNVEVFAVAVGDGPNMGMINAIASNSTTTNHIYPAMSSTDVATVTSSILNILCV